MRYFQRNVPTNDHNSIVWFSEHNVHAQVGTFEPTCYDTDMKPLVHQKEQAILLRKKGYTYNEILVHVPVAKSSLSLWLKDLPLTKVEKNSLKHRRTSQISHGRIKAAGVLYQKRLLREKEQLQEAKVLFSKYHNKPLFHVGIALYWAEGGKRTNTWQFMNSDEAMQRVMISWLTSFVGINKDDLRFRLYIHKVYQSENCEHWWAESLNVSPEQFLKTIIKPSNRGVKKRPNYKGCLRIEVRNSKPLLNKMRFWQKMLVEFCIKQ